MGDGISAEKLTAAGYERINPRMLLLKDPFLIAVWRKHVSDERGIRYTISISETDISGITDRPAGMLFKAETHFRFTNGGWSTVTHSIDHQHIDDVEDYFEEIWNHMGFDYTEGGYDCEGAARTAGER